MNLSRISNSLNSASVTILKLQDRNPFFVVYIVRKVLYVRKVSSETSISELVNHGWEVNQILRETVIQVS